MRKNVKHFVLTIPQFYYSFSLKLMSIFPAKQCGKKPPSASKVRG